MDLQNAYNLVKDFIVKEGDYVHSNWHHMNIVKTADGGADVTTDFDQHVEKAFNEFVLEHFPDCGFRGEEHADYNRHGEYT
ncbi:hypothetical protein KC717_05815 [Candidatus Dojkabacteria bacterium]|uniref:Uncharacterized protein n=1 Tax=Candidatus Dojkabacteria bacterium TaxID=2099670 RepID=A0A955L9I6_9BACT|nr:hypothetical protein [Candidatus Dojkabacteria bacterium]